MFFQKNLFNTSPKEKKSEPSSAYIPIRYIPIVRGYMVDGYEMDVYEWLSMSLHYPLIYTLTTL